MLHARLLGIAVLGALALAAQAGASNGKTCEVVDRFASDYADSVDCSEFGTFDFDNEFGGRQKVSVTDVYGDDGTLLQTVLHIHLDETERNSKTGHTLALNGTVHEVWDCASNTRTISGAVWIGHVPGGGTFVRTPAGSR